MIRAVLLATAATLDAGPALALSCLEPSVARSFEEARASAEVYVVVLGRFEFEAPEPGEPASVTATFDGRVLGRDGFVTEVRRPVTMEISCLSVWCGHIEPGVETLAFVEQEEEGLSVAITPCSGWVFVKPTPEQVLIAESCMSGSCE